MAKYPINCFTVLNLPDYISHDVIVNYIIINIYIKGISTFNAEVGNINIHWVIMIRPSWTLNTLKYFIHLYITSWKLCEQDQKSIDAIESDLVREPGLIIDDNIIEEITDGCSGPVVLLIGSFDRFF